MTLQFFALFGFMFAALQYLQLVRGYSPLEAAFALIPLAMTVGFLSRVVAPRLIVRFGHRPVDAAGLAVLAVGFGILATLDVDSAYLHVLAGLVPLAAGIGLATTPATASIVESLPPAKQGVASAVNDTAREVGGAVGIAVPGQRAQRRLPRRSRPAHGPAPARGRRAGRRLARLRGAGRRPLRPAGQDLLAAARQAFVDGFNTTMVVASVVMAVGALVVFGGGGRGRAGLPGRPGHAPTSVAPARPGADPAPALSVDAVRPGATDRGRPVSPGLDREAVEIGCAARPHPGEGARPQHLLGLRRHAEL